MWALSRSYRFSLLRSWVGFFLLVAADDITSDIEIKKEQPMRLHEWKVTIQEMVDQCNHEENRSDKVLMEWRAKLEKEPTLLQPFQIDEIVREVRQRLSNVNP